MLQGLLEGKKLVMVGGKGGVGKSTCASAIALWYAKEDKGPVLIISTDPTPSLSDIFEQPIGDRITSIGAFPNLHAQEISPELVLSLWRKRFGKEIYEVVKAFSNLEEDFVLDYVGSAPGIEEEYVLYYIWTLVKEGRYRTVVWDTAPAGHTLRLLKVPALFLKHLEGATRFYLQLFSYVEKVKGAFQSKPKKGIIDIIQGWKELSADIESFLRDRKAVSYVLVTIPEALGVNQTKRILNELRDHGLWIDLLVVNQYVSHPDCQFHKARKEMQDRYLKEIFFQFKDLPIKVVPSLAEEVKGITSLERFCQLLFS